MALAVCKTLVRTSLSSAASTIRSTTAPSSPTLCLSPRVHSHQASLFLCSPSLAQTLTPAPRLAAQHKLPWTPSASIHGSAVPIEQNAESPDEDNVERLLTHKDDVKFMMKMERRPPGEPNRSWNSGRWFPYLDRFKCGTGFLTSSEVLEATESLIMDSRKERFMKVARNRSYSVCLVIEGLSDFGNVSATFRSADALGFQSVHVVACDSSKRYRENRHVSMGAEKWLDIELWDSIKDCFEALKSRGYRIVTTHVGMDAVSVYDMDWSCPTAIVVGNESRGISDEALELSDLHCSIPMNGMVDSFNVSVAAGIIMHQAVCDRTSRLGSHGDLTVEESQILLAEFSLRHSRSSISIANEYAKRKEAMFFPKL